MSGPVLALRAVGVAYDGRRVLSGVDQGLAAAISIVLVTAATALLARERMGRTSRTAAVQLPAPAGGGPAAQDVPAPRTADPAEHRPRPVTPA